MEITEELINLYKKRKSIRECSEKLKISQDEIIKKLIFLEIYGKFFCSKKNHWMNFEDFHKKTSAKFGINTICKECVKERDKKRRENNKEIIRKKQKQYYSNNREQVLERNKKYSKNNSEKIKNRKKTYYEENKEYFKERNKKYYKENKDKIINRHKEYKKDLIVRKNLNLKAKERRNIDFKFKINQNLSKQIGKSLKFGKEGNSWKNLVDFSLDELVNYLKIMVEKLSNYNFDDYFNGKLHLDHIRPISSFNYESYHDPNFKKCWNLDNFQLLPSNINRSKSDKWDGTEENVSFNLKYVTLAELQENLNNF